MKNGGDVSLFKLSAWDMPLAEGFVGWFIGTFFFYWWHRLRHAKGFWLVFHQVHHSPSRIEILTSFYKHPVEILSAGILSALVLYPLLGCSMMGAFWYNFFGATGEYFYHANVRMPKWLRFFIQTPELHSIHHQYDVHQYNFADIPCGIVCSALIKTQRSSPTAVASQRGLKKSSVICWCLKMFTTKIPPDTAIIREETKYSSLS